jgi:hypothetical protein
MPRKPTPSFILELPLRTSPADERARAIMLDAARNIGNAVLGEGLRRLDLMRKSKAYQAARKMSRGEPRSPARKARKKPLRQRYHQFPDGTRVGRDLYSAFLARYVQDGCLDAIQAANAWTGTQAFLRAASDGFEPARGRSFALAHVTLGGRAGRSNNGAKCTRKAGNAVAVAHVAAARVPKSSAAGTQAPALARGSFTVDNPRCCALPNRFKETGS